MKMVINIVWKMVINNNIEYSNKYWLNDVSNGNKYSIKCALKQVVVNWVWNGNQYRLNGYKNN